MWNRFDGPSTRDDPRASQGLDRRIQTVDSSIWETHQDVQHNDPSQSSAPTSLSDKLGINEEVTPRGSVRSMRVKLTEHEIQSRTDSWTDREQQLEGVTRHDTRIGGNGLQRYPDDQNCTARLLRLARTLHVRQSDPGSASWR